MNLLGTQEAADRLGISRQRVLQIIKGGRLPTVKVGKVHLIKESDLKLVEHRPLGRPPWKNKRKKRAVKPERSSSDAFKSLLDTLRPKA